MKFYQYLAEKGLLHVLDGPTEEINKVRKAYRSEYKREYRKQYQKARVHRILIFSHEEYALLRRASKNHNLPFSTFVRESAMNYLSRGFLVPDKEQVKSLLVALKKYGVLLNQIAYKVNSTNAVPPDSYSEVLTNYRSLESEIKQIFTEPQLIEDFITEVISKEPGYIEIIQTILDKHNK